MLSGTVDPVPVQSFIPNVPSAKAVEVVLARHEAQRRRKRIKNEKCWSGTLLFGFLMIEASRKEIGMSSLTDQDLRKLQDG